MKSTIKIIFINNRFDVKNISNVNRPKPASSIIMCLLLFQYNILNTLFLKDRPRSGIRLEFEFHKCNWRKPDTKCQVPKKAGTRLRLPPAPFIPSLNCSNPDASLLTPSSLSHINLTFWSWALMVLSSSLGHFTPLSPTPPLIMGWGVSVWTLWQQSPSYLQGNPFPQPYLAMVMSSFSFIKCKEHLTAWEAK